MSDEQVIEIIESIAGGDLSQINTSKLPNKKISQVLNHLVDNLRGIVKQTRIISQGRYDIEFCPKSDKDELGIAVSDMINMLRDMAVENKKSAWIKTGQAELANILRGDQEVRDLGRNVISFLAKYLNALVGTIYQMDKQFEDQLEMIGSYAYQRRKWDRSKIKLGEGLVGQCALEKEVIIFSNVPEDYISINSSLGEMVPKNLVVFPFLIEEEVIGVLELGFHEYFDPLKMDLLNQVSENIAIALKSSQNSEKMKKLLIESKRNSEILQSQQEELRSSNEMLQAQQDKLRSSNEELERQAVILKRSEEEIRIKNEELKENTSFLEKQSNEIEKARVELERKAKELEQASKYKTEFLANMSHELRTPLNSLLILSKHLSENEEKNLTPDQIESIEVIHKGGQDLLSLINDILDLSKVEAGKLHIHLDPLNVSTITTNLQRQFSPFANQKSLEFQVIIEENVPPLIKTDGQRVEQILKNFLSNAFKFTKQGKITLKVDRPTSQISFKNSKLNWQNCLGFAVSDTGIGISKEHREIIFEAFQQGDGSTSRKYGGTGLGLSISRELSKILGGEIHLDSETGIGSTFTLYLPCFQEQKEKESSIQDDRETLKEGDKTLLIIEDDPHFAKVLIEHARKKNYKCLFASNGSEGLFLATEYKPNGITLDLKLPDKKGSEILEQLKNNSQTGHIPVHIISADEDEFFSLKKGAVGHLVKPIQLSDFEKALANIEKIKHQTIKNVLLVEDLKTEQKSIEELLHGDTVALTIAESGGEALRYIQKNIFDCVILDLHLPDMSGIEILKKMEQILTKLPPVIIYTGRELDKQEYQELNAYTSSFIVKGEGSHQRLLDELFIFLHKIKPSKKEKERDFSLSQNMNISLENKKILLVDDDMRNIYALSGVLRKKGMKIVLADNGQTALDKLSSEPNIDLVIMDIMMPVMDGFEAMRRIRLQQKFANLPIIALTAKILPEDKNKALESGANDFLTKPVEMDKLIALIKLWLSNAVALTG